MYSSLRFGRWSVALMVCAGCGLPVDETSVDDGGEHTAEARQALQLSLTSIMTLARNAGLPCSRLVLAGAVAMGESSGYTNAYHVNGPSSACPNGSVDRGLWQINNCYWDYSKACLYDAACNAGAMATVSNNGSYWGYWVAYTNGSYQSYLGAAQAAYDAGIPGCGSSPPPSGSSCSALGYTGTCVGNTSIWWQNGSCKVRDCASEGRSCGWISSSVGWGCLGGSSGSSTVNCSSLGYDGMCAVDDTLVWYESGACRWKHCPDSGRSCAWAGSIGYNCVW
jgi:hypothetical protein